MLDFLRDLAKPAAEKRQERLNAYMDGALSAKERRQFEQELEADPHLQAELSELQQVRAGLRRIPRLRAPRNFTLDPAAYGRPAPDRVAQWYPALRAVTAVVAVAFAFVLVAQLFLTPGAFPTIRERDFEAASAIEEAADEAAEAAFELESEPAVEEEMLDESTLPAMELPAEAAERDAEVDALEEAEAAADITVPTRELAAPAAPSGSTSEAAEGSAEFAPTLEPTASPTIEPTATIRPTATPVPTRLPTPTSTADEGEVGEPAPSISTLLLVEIALGLTLVILVIALLAFRRRL